MQIIKLIEQAEHQSNRTMLKAILRLNESVHTTPE